jgi:hypothetical protein
MKLPAALAAALLLNLCAAAQPAPKAVTVPITLDHNRTIIDVYLQLPDGKPKRVRAWVDNGNAELWVTGALAAKLNLTLSGEPRPALEGQQRSVEVPSSLLIGAMKIPLDGVHTANALLAVETVAPGCSAEITIPSTVLRNYDVLFDYPNRQFTIGPPGSIPFKGESSKVILSPENGLIQVASNINGKDSNLALDLGASITLVEGEVLDQWHNEHASWPHTTGAVGPANMYGTQDEAQRGLLRIPTLRFGSTTLRNVAVSSFPAEHWKWFEQRAGVPTIGLLGAAALLNDRVGLDYAHSTISLQPTSASTPSTFDVVGLALHPEPDGRYTVLGIANYDGKPSVPDVKPGDILLGVDGAPATGATMGQVWSLLGGTPGQARTLTLERDGKRFSVEAPVRRFLPLTSATPAKSPRRNPHRRN